MSNPMRSHGRCTYEAAKDLIQCYGWEMAACHATAYANGQNKRAQCFWLTVAALIQLWKPA